MGSADSIERLLELVEPELRPAALQMRQLYAQLTPMSIEKLAQRRATMASMVQPLLPDVAVTEQQIAGAANSPDVTLYIVNPRPGAQRPGILHMHGGGFTSSTASGSLPHLQAIARDLDCTIVSVDFRNAPEARHHESLEDNYAALRWLHANSAEVGIDARRIALLGESGGGGHAALLALAARDRGEIPVFFQMLIYPMIDDRTGSSRLMPPHLGAFGWNAEMNRFGWRCFLGQEPGTDAVPAAAVPARSANLAGLPPTFIGVGALDIFVDEDIEYARRLVAVGVPTELLVVPGAFHGFDMLVKDAVISRRFYATKVEALRRAFGTG